MKLQNYISCLCLLCALCLPLAAQQQGILPRRASEAEEEEEPIGQSVLQFDQTEACFPRLEETDAPYTVVYHYVNQSAQPLTIDKVTVSCGCMKAAYDNRSIPVHGKGSIKISFNPHGYSGKIYRQAWVYTSLSKERPTARLTLSGEVAPSKDPWRGYPHHLGALRAKQKTVVFSVANRSGKVAEVIACGNSGDRPLRLSARGLPPYLTFQTIPSVIEPGAEADLVFVLEAAQLPAEAKEVISVPVRLEGLEDSAENPDRIVTAIIQFDK